jgi:hypothetical protein
MFSKLFRETFEEGAPSSTEEEAFVRLDIFGIFNKEVGNCE